MTVGFVTFFATLSFPFAALRAAHVLYLVFLFLTIKLSVMASAIHSHLLPPVGFAAPFSHTRFVLLVTRTFSCKSQPPFWYLLCATPCMTTTLQQLSSPQYSGLQCATLQSHITLFFQGARCTCSPGPH